MIDLESMIYMLVRLITIGTEELLAPAVVVILFFGSFIVYKLKKQDQKTFIFTCVCTLLLLALFSQGVYREYLLSCLDSENDRVAAWAYHHLSDEGLSDEWYISILNDKRESEYVRFYIAQIVADRLQHDSRAQQELILNRLNNAPEVSKPYPFTTTDENRNAQKIAFPVPAKELVTQLMASTN